MEILFLQLQLMKFSATNDDNDNIGSDYNNNDYRWFWWRWVPLKKMAQNMFAALTMIFYRHHMLMMGFPFILNMMLYTLDQQYHMSMV